MLDRRRTDKDRKKDGDLGVAIRTQEGQTHPGRIVRVSNDRVTIAFTRAETPKAEIGDTVKLLFRTIRGGELTATGRMVEEAERIDKERCFEFCFEAPERPVRDRDDEIPITGDDEDNLRRAFRVQPDRRELPIVMRPFGDPRGSVLRQLTDLRMHGAHRTIKAWIHDISPEGMAILVDDDVAHQYDRREHLDLSFHLPGCEDPLLIGAHVVHRNDVRIGTLYGLSFDQEVTPHFQWVQGRVLEFVIKEQQRLLRLRAG